MQPLHTFQCSHGLLLVVLSYMISVFGAYCCLQVAVEIPQARGRLQVEKLAVSAVAMGGGATWSMHFIAMTSCRLPFPVTYDPIVICGSLLIAIVVTGFGLKIVGSHRIEPVRFMSGGTFMGLGIAAMHYTGIAAMRMSARIIWRPVLVLASILIAMGAAMLALWLAFNLLSRMQRLGSAFVMAGAVCGLHYAGMAAAVFVPEDQSLTASRSQPVNGSDELGFTVFGLTLLVLALILMESRVTDAKRAEERLRRSYEALRSLAERLRDVREEEATRIAREVHDEVGQMLTALRLDVAWMEKKLASSLPREELAGKLQSMTLLLDAAGDAVQRVMSELRPGLLDNLGLEAAVEWYVGQFEKRTGFSCRLRSSLGGTAIDAERSTALFRILQEALTNVARHANASEVEIRLAAEAGRIVLAVTDNGSGIPKERVDDARALGLLGMRERARSLGGDVVVRRGADHGTTVEATLPL